MVTREYFCKNCEYQYETVQPMFEALHEKCPNCKKKKLIQDLSASKVYFSMKTNHSDIKTIHHYATRNTEKMSKLERQSREAKIQAEKDQILKERDENLEKAGYKRYKGRETKTEMEKFVKDLPPLQSEIKQRIAKGDQAGVDKYIKEGK